MRAATVVQVLQDFEVPPTIAPRPPTIVAYPHIDRSLESNETHIQSHNPRSRRSGRVARPQIPRRQATTDRPTGKIWQVRFALVLSSRNTPPRHNQSPKRCIAIAGRSPTSRRFRDAYLNPGQRRTKAFRGPSTRRVTAETGPARSGRRINDARILFPQDAAATQSAR